MTGIKEININLEELEREKKKYFEERLKFIDFWTEYIRNNPDKKWSKEQKNIIDSQCS